MLPDTATRVHRQTAQPVNEVIERSTAADFARRAGRGPEDIGEGIRELEQEWDIERTR